MRWRQICGRRYFDHFLVTPLHGAIAFVEMQQIAVIVGENLDFEMARTRQIFFKKDAGIAEGRFCFALSFFEALVQFSLARALRACRGRRRPWQLSR